MANMLFIRLSGESKSSNLALFADFLETAWKFNTKFYTIIQRFMYVSFPNKIRLTSTMAKLQSYYLPRECTWKRW